MRKALLILLTVPFTMPACALFAPGPVLASSSVAGCSSLIDPSWKDGVGLAEPPEEATVGAWIKAFDAQTGKVEQANERTAAVIGITERCEARDRAAEKKAMRRRLF